MSLPWRKPRKKRPLVKMWTPPGAPAKKAPAKKAVPKKAVAKKDVASKAGPKKDVERKAVAKKDVANKAGLDKDTAKKTPAKKAPAKKTLANKAVATSAAAKAPRTKKVNPWKPEVPDHPLFVPMRALPEWAHTLLGASTEIIEFPEVVRDPMVVQITYDGPDRFRFRLRDETGSEDVFEISGSGSFYGRYPLNFEGGRGFKYVMVEATSSWIVHFEAVTQMRVLAAQVGAKIEGQGSDVVRFHAQSPMRLDFSAPFTKDRIEIGGYSQRRYRGLLSESRGFEGTILTESNMVLLEVVMAAPWKNDTRWTLTVGDISGSGSG